MAAAPCRDGKIGGHSRTSRQREGQSGKNSPFSLQLLLTLKTAWAEFPHQRRLQVKKATALHSQSNLEAIRPSMNAFHSDCGSGATTLEQVLIEKICQPFLNLRAAEKFRHWSNPPRSDGRLSVRHWKSADSRRFFSNVRPSASLVARRLW